jgi:hypothetical protein
MVKPMNSKEKPSLIKYEELIVAWKRKQFEQFAKGAV